jgi:hypothetical protein
LHLFYHPDEYSYVAFGPSSVEHFCMSCDGWVIQWNVFTPVLPDLPQYNKVFINRLGWFECFPHHNVQTSSGAHPGSFLGGVEQLGCEAYCSPPSSAKVNAWSSTSTSSVCLNGIVLN